MEAHAGPTPMESRKDALQVAAGLMQKVVAIAHERAPHGRGTVGAVEVLPNSRNVIPGRVKFSVDLRHPDSAGLDAMEQTLRAAVDEAARSSGLSIELELVSQFKPCVFDTGCVGAVERAAAHLGYSHMPAVSGAGHDAVHVAKVAPAAMIFIPCKDGISHNEIEYAKPEHLEAGCNVLLHVMLEHAGVVG
jgi:N-carbamoyl-L-amino-acid hydrolase